MGAMDGGVKKEGDEEDERLLVLRAIQPQVRSVGYSHSGDAAIINAFYTSRRLFHFSLNYAS